MHFYFLQKDYEALEKKIKAKRKEFKNLSQEVEDGCDQTSETWHDNFAFEEAARMQKMIMSELEKLYELRNYAILVKKTDRPANEVSIGKKVKIQNNQTGDIKEYLVGSYMVLNKTDKNEVSYKAPLLQ